MNAQPSSLFFIHVPKAAGTTFKAFLEDHYAHGEALSIPDRVAEGLPRETLNRHALFCGHYSSDVIAALEPKPRVKVALLREPIERFRSWTANCRRVRDQKFAELLLGRTDLDVVAGPANHVCFQAYWLARALYGGAQYAALPAQADLSGLLDQVEIVGVTEEIERVMQLVAFRMGWPPPPAGWLINRSPGAAAAAARKRSSADDEAIRPHLALDERLYDLACRRFWGDYCDMLQQIAPDGAPWTPEIAAATPREAVQGWLRDEYFRRAPRSPKVTRLTMTAGSPVQGEGWWWREVPGKFAYRWSGPDAASSLYLAPLMSGRDYQLTVDFMGACDWPTWERVELEVNDRPTPCTLEPLDSGEPNGPSLRLRARITAGLVAGQREMTRLTFRVPETRAVHRHIMVLETFETYNPDDRAKGVALHRVHIEPLDTVALVAPTERHETAKPMIHENTLSSYLNEGYTRINGWLNMPAVEATLAVAEIQRELACPGPVCEIGVWQGRYLTLLSFLADEPQRIVGIDPFVHVQDRDKQIAQLRDNIHAFARRPDLVTILERDSRALTPEAILAATGGPCQFVSVDGDHTMAGCLHDMWLAEAILAPGGVVAVDDICNMACPGVVDAAVRYGTAIGARLAPFLIAGNKLFMTQVEHCASFRQAVLDRCRAGRVGHASKPIADFAARMEALHVPVEFLDQPILVHP